MTLILLKFLVFIVTTGWLFLQELKEVKEPYDSQRLPFDFRNDFWRYYWDNVGIQILGCILGFALSHELAVPIIEKYLEWPELAEKAIDLTSIMICTGFAGRILDFMYKRFKA